MRVLAALLVCVSLASCAPAARPAEGPPLWHIQDEDSDIWLFGTVHVLPGDLAWRSAELDAAFTAADELVVETDASDPSVATLAGRYGLLPAGETLSERLSADTRARLGRVLQQLQVNPAEIEPMRPWLAGLRLSFLYAVSRGQESESGVEAVLLPRARAAGKSISYLETPEQQIRTLADLSEDDQLRFLDSTLREIEDHSDTIEAMQRDWVAGDVAGLTALLDSEMRDAGPGAYDAIIVRRNRAWTAEIQRRLAGSGHTFYAVGAAHLLGGDSVVAQLRAEGVTVDGP